MPKINPLHTTMSMVVCANADDAIQRGYNYSAKPDEFKPIQVKEVVVVLDGTQTNKPTVDFVLENEAGEKFVFVITSALLHMIPNKA